MKVTAHSRASGPSWTLPPRSVGGFFLWTSGIHVGIVAADPVFYQHFADSALVPGLAPAWRSVFMSHAALYGLVVASAEAALALLLLGSPRSRRAGWCGVVGFHAALLCFGWGFWVWSLPALALLVRSARRDWSGAYGPGSRDPMTLVDQGP